MRSATLNTSCGELTTELTFACSNCSAPFSIAIVATIFLSRKLRIPLIAVMDVSLRYTPHEADVRIAPDLAPPGSFGPQPDPVPVVHVVDVASLGEAHYTTLHYTIRYYTTP